MINFFKKCNFKDIVSSNFKRSLTFAEVQKKTSEVKNGNSPIHNISKSKLFNNFPEQSLPYFVGSDGDVTMPFFGQHSKTSSVLYNVGQLFNASRTDKDTPNNLIANTLFHTKNLIYHPYLRVLFLKGELSKMDLTQFLIYPGDLRKICEFHLQNYKVDVDVNEYKKNQEFFNYIHGKIFNEILNLTNMNIYNSKFILLKSKLIAKNIIENNSILFEKNPELKNLDLVTKLIIGEFLGILFGTNLPAFQNLHPSKYNLVVPLLKNFELFELHFYDHILKSTYNIEDALRVHAESPSTTQSPIRDMLKLTRFVPMQSSYTDRNIVPIVSLVGLEYRSSNTLRGVTSEHLLYEMAKVFYSNKDNFSKDIFIKEVFDFYNKNETKIAYNNLIIALENNNNTAYELIENFYGTLWDRFFQSSIAKGFQEILTVRIGSLNFLADLSYKSSQKISKIVEKTFVEQQNKSKSTMKSNMIKVFIPNEVTGDIFAITENNSKIVRAIAGDYGQVGGFNDGVSMASDEQSIQRMITLAGLLPYGVNPAKFRSNSVGG